MDDEEVLAYLEAENEYFDASMAPYQGLIDTIYKEIEGREVPQRQSLLPRLLRLRPRRRRPLRSPSLAVA